MANLSEFSLTKLASGIRKEDFTSEEKIEYISDLTGIFPFDLVMTQEIRDSIEKNCVPPLGNWDKDLGVAWFIPREVIPKKTKNDKLYWIIKVIDEAAHHVPLDSPLELTCIINNYLDKWR